MVAPINFGELTIQSHKLDQSSFQSIISITVILFVYSKQYTRNRLSSYGKGQCEML